MFGRYLSTVYMRKRKKTDGMKRGKSKQTVFTFRNSVVKSGSGSKLDPYSATSGIWIRMGVPNTDQFKVGRKKWTDKMTIKNHCVNSELSLGLIIFV